MPIASRRTRKHLLDDAEASLVSAALDAALQRDRHGDRGRYHVRSVYFDDPSDSVLEDHRAGLGERHKWRIRLYDRSDRRIRLERKRRSDRVEVKDVCLVSRRTAEALLAGELPEDPPGDELLAQFVAEQRACLLRPAVLVDYLREAWTHPTCALRVTLDRELRTTLRRLDPFDPALPTLPVLEGRHRTVLEVKASGGEPAWIGALLPSTLRPAEALSKYVTCRTHPGWREP